MSCLVEILSSIRFVFFLISIEEQTHDVISDINVYRLSTPRHQCSHKTDASIIFFPFFSLKYQNNKIYRNDFCVWVFLLFPSGTFCLNSLSRRSSPFIETRKWSDFRSCEAKCKESVINFQLSLAKKNAVQRESE